METIIRKIFQQELSETLQSVEQIIGLGSVNEIYKVRGNHQEYILRINRDISPLEYPKEEWCMATAAILDIPSPTVIKLGNWGEYRYMIQNKLPGSNGNNCPKEEQAIIWTQLGRYARQFHQVKHIDVAAVVKAEFHQDWKARLRYNLAELNEEDSLLVNGHFSREEHQLAKMALACLEYKELRTGLVHGDLCPRNTLFDQGEVYLLDWGTAEVNVVPHLELGILQMAGECSAPEFQCFLEGYGISKAEYQAMETDVNLLKFLHRLDKYRWAETYATAELPDFIAKVRAAFELVKGVQ